MNFEIYLEDINSLIEISNQSAIKRFRAGAGQNTAKHAFIKKKTTRTGRPLIGDCSCDTQKPSQRDSRFDRGLGSGIKVREGDGFAKGGGGGLQSPHVSSSFN